MQKILAFFKTHLHALWGLYVPVYLAMFFAVERLVTGEYWATQLPVDDYIPFCEYFIVIYDLWAFLLVAVGVYLILRDAEGFRRYMWMLAITFTAATVFCALVPNGQDLRPAVMERQNVFTAIVQGTYALDTNTNVFPSVHVLGVMTALAAVYHTPGLRRWYWRAGATVVGLLIVAATLLVKQHAVIDVVGSLAFGAVGYVIVYVCIARRRDRRAAEQKGVPEETPKEPDGFCK